MSFRRSGSGLGTPPSRKRPLPTASGPTTPTRRVHYENPQFEATTPSTSTAFRLVKPKASTPTASTSKDHNNSSPPKKAKPRQVRKFSTANILYDSRLMDRAKLGSFFKVVAALPVAPIAAAAQLGWRNVFSSSSPSPERDRSRKATAKTGTNTSRVTSAVRLREEKEEEETVSSSIAPPPLPSTPQPAQEPGNQRIVQQQQQHEGEDVEGWSKKDGGDGDVVGGREALEQQVQGLQARVEELWDELHVPDPDRSLISRRYFLGGPDYGNHPEAARRALLYEFLSLLRHRQHTLEVLRAIREREKCMVYLKTMYKRFREHPTGFRHPTKGHGHRQLFVECLALARDTSLLCVESIVRWRKQLWRKKPFLWKSDQEGGRRAAQNYLERMTMDAARFLTTEGGLELLAAIDLTAGDLGVLAPEHEEVVVEGGEGEGGGRQESPEESVYRQAFLRHSFEGEQDKDFSFPGLRRRLRTAIRTLRQERGVEFEQKLEAFRLKEQGLFVPLLRPQPLSRLHKALAEAHDDDGGGDHYLVRQGGRSSSSSGRKKKEKHADATRGQRGGAATQEAVMAAVGVKGNDDVGKAVSRQGPAEDVEGAPLLGLDILSRTDRSNAPSPSPSEVIVYTTTTIEPPRPRPPSSSSPTAASPPRSPASGTRQQVVVPPAVTSPSATRQQHQGSAGVARKIVMVGNDVVGTSMASTARDSSSKDTPRTPPPPPHSSSLSPRRSPKKTPPPTSLSPQHAAVAPPIAITKATKADQSSAAGATVMTTTDAGRDDGGGNGDGGGSIASVATLAGDMDLYISPAALSPAGSYGSKEEALQADIVVHNKGVMVLQVDTTTRLPSIPGPDSSSSIALISPLSMASAASPGAPPSPAYSQDSFFDESRSVIVKAASLDDHHHPDPKQAEDVVTADDCSNVTVVSLIRRPLDDDSDEEEEEEEEAKSAPAGGDGDGGDAHDVFDIAMSPRNSDEEKRAAVAMVGVKGLASAAFAAGGDTATAQAATTVTTSGSSEVVVNQVSAVQPPELRASQAPVPPSPITDQQAVSETGIEAAGPSTAEAPSSSNHQQQQRLPPRSVPVIITTATSSSTVADQDPATEKHMTYGPSIYDLAFSPKSANNSVSTVAATVASSSSSLSERDGISTTHHEEEEARNIYDVDELDDNVSVAESVRGEQQQPQQEASQESILTSVDPPAPEKGNTTTTTDSKRADAVVVEEEEEEDLKLPASVTAGMDEKKQEEGGDGDAAASVHSEQSTVYGPVSEEEEEEEEEEGHDDTNDMMNDGSNKRSGGKRNEGATPPPVMSDTGVVVAEGESKGAGEGQEGGDILMKTREEGRLSVEGGGTTTTTRTRRRSSGVLASTTSGIKGLGAALLPCCLTVDVVDGNGEEEEEGGVMVGLQAEATARTLRDDNVLNRMQQTTTIKKSPPAAAPPATPAAGPAAAPHGDDHIYNVNLDD